MPIILPINQITTALVDAVDALIGKMGETITYTFHDGTPSVTIRAVRQRLRQEELVGDYMQGDCKFTINYKTLPQPPAKYDSILAADGKTYQIIDYLAVDKGINNVLLVYIPVGRG